MTPATVSYLKKARELCTAKGALLIFDEVQSGMGRTGTLYAYEQFGVVPDILTTAKALGCGFPVGAMLTTTEVAAALAVGTHGSTYGGNPLACAVSLKALELISSPEVLQGIQQRHAKLKAGLEAIQQESGVFKAVRGMGLLMGCELADEWKGQAKALMTAAQRKGVLVLMAGPDVLRLAPSLIIPESDLAAGLAGLREAVAELKASKT